MCEVTKDQVLENIATVIDPEVGFNMVELGLIYDVIIDAACNAKVVMTLSTRACPLHQMLEQWVREAAERTEGINEATVEIVWEPAWNITMAADNVKQALGAMPTP